MRLTPLLTELLHLLLLGSLLTVSGKKQQGSSALTVIGQPGRCRATCRATVECCPPQVCSTPDFYPRLGYARYGACVINRTPCKPPCGRGQVCAPARRQRKRFKPGTPKTRYTCLKHLCFTNNHCAAGSTCQYNNKGNCCWPTTCATKCSREQRCQRLPRRCRNPGPNPTPCYCPPIYQCVGPRSGPRCNPPCRNGMRCVETSCLPGNVGNTYKKKYVCVRDRCYSDKNCAAGSFCIKDKRGNCCYPRTCARKCPANQRCQRLARRCPNPGPNAPPCYCPPIYRCVGLPPGPRCNPPCRNGMRCGVASSLPWSVGKTPTKKYVCVRDRCYSDKNCAAGSVCRKDQRGNCCYPRTCAKKCPVSQRCQRLARSCPNPGPNPPPCYCPPVYRCVVP